MKMRWVVLLVLLVFPASRVQAQESELTLKLRRTFGYQAGSEIQGSFTLELSSLSEAIQVNYLIDGEVFASVTEAPFRTSFSTSAYPAGAHQLQAIVTSNAGEKFESQVVNLTFVTAEDSWQTGGRMAAWILGGVLILMLIGMLGTGYFARNRGRFQLGVYGPAGGAVCGRCTLPFSRHVFGLNLMLGKLERCPHCGKVAIVPRAALEALEAAEARYRADQVEGHRAVRDEDANLKQQLDDSRFER